ncbi:GAF domain-containing protein [Plantactinospora soyae]|uniref:HTH luxR-type domain-containing protein n=1 Tax=Plantactinospora soyae TaxID=1544732 RepID=A0A927M2T0_9ACTN|nr:GAF domain-containing protein [Plantactinospora soyae]MBE1485817.1 hypothetical protein [Plantactinospora soyae]
MSGLPRSVRAVTRAVAEIAAAPVHGDQPEELLALLRQVIPFQAAWLGLLDDERRRYVRLATTGYDDRTRRYLGTPEIADQVDLCGLSTTPAPQSARDSPVPLDELPVWPEYYRPAGFRGGLAVGLFAQDRRHLGLLVLNTEDRDHPTDGERDLIGALAPRLATVVDPIRSVAVLARIVRDAVGGVVLTRGGAALPLPGLPEHVLLAPDSALLPVAVRQQALTDGCGSFLWPVRPYPEADERDDFVRVAVLNCPPGRSQLVAVVVLSAPPGDRPVLSRSELRILGMLLDGWLDQRIAVAMDLPARVVAEMTDRITARLGAPDLHSALLRAARWGWFIPHRLTAPSP